MQVTTVLVEAEAKQTQKGIMFKFKESNGSWLATNDRALADQAKALLNQTVVLEISEQVSNKINEYTGKPYLNRYLNGIVSTTPAAQPVQTDGWGTATPAASATSGFSTTLTAPSVQVEITARDRSIWAQSASKVAAELLRYFPEGERTLNAFDKIVTREIEKYEKHHKGIAAPTPAEIASTFSEAGMVPTSVTDTPPHGDEDIPF